MRIYPAIDLLDGKCVRLVRGEFASAVSYTDDPIQMAQNFAAQGLHYLHIVDLNGAKQGVMQQEKLIADIVASTNLQVQIGGGIRDFATVKNLLSMGVDRVILGSVAVTQPSLVKECLQTWGGEKIVLAIDVRPSKNVECQTENDKDRGAPELLRNFSVAIKGWQETVSMNLWQLLDSYQEDGLKNILCTDISKDGTLSGPNFELYDQCYEQFPHMYFIASGGISSPQDLVDLNALGVHAVVIGKAIYENKVSLTCLQDALFPA